MQQKSCPSLSGWAGSMAPSLAVVLQHTMLHTGYPNQQRLLSDKATLLVSCYAGSGPGKSNSTGAEHMHHNRGMGAKASGKKGGQQLQLAHYYFMVAVCA